MNQGREQTSHTQKKQKWQKKKKILRFKWMDIKIEERHFSSIKLEKYTVCVCVRSLSRVWLLQPHVP